MLMPVTKSYAELLLELLCDLAVTLLTGSHFLTWQEHGEPNFTRDEGLMLWKRFERCGNALNVAGTLCMSWVRSERCGYARNAMGTRKTL